MRKILIAHWCFSCCWLVLTPSQRLPVFRALPVKTCTRNGEGAQPGQAGPELAKGIFRTMESHAQNINWEELARSCWSLLGDERGIGQRVVSNCIAHHLFLWFIFDLVFCLFVCFYFVSIIKLLSQPTRYFLIFFSRSPPHSPGGRGEWESCCVALSCQVGLNCDWRWETESRSEWSVP